MSNFLLIDHIQVQDANTIAGFTWGFPAITHFLGFVHLLQRKIYKHADFKDITLGGCAVIAHDQQTSTYHSSGSTIAFTQSRNPPYLASHAKDSPPPIIEEGKMSMTVSILIEVEESVGQYGQVFIDWVKQQSYLQRLAGGSIFNIAGATGFSIKSDDNISLKALQRKLLPGFALINRSDLLDKHFDTMQANDSSTEIFDAWIDFVALKRQARPAYDLIDHHLTSLIKDQGDKHIILFEEWQKHLKRSYNSKDISQKLSDYFNNLVVDKANKSLINQWQQYIEPTDRTPAKWEYEPKPARGYLVPIVCGYKAISEVLNNDEVTGTRDSETDVCFVEAVHSIGEWQSVHRWKNLDAIYDALWQYNYSPDWYLCSHKHIFETSENEISYEIEDLLMQDPSSF